MLTRLKTHSFIHSFIHHLLTYDVMRAWSFTPISSIHLVASVQRQLYLFPMSEKPLEIVHNSGVCWTLICLMYLTL